MTPFPIKTISLPLIAAGLLIVPGCDSGEVVEPGEPATAAVRVQPVAVVQKEIQHSTRQPATVRGYYETEIRSRAAGYAKSVQVDIGDVVEEGQLLAEIAVPETEKRREVAQANVQLLEAQARAAEQVLL